MITTTHAHKGCAGSAHTDTELLNLEVEGELTTADHCVGHEYLPMDVFVDARTIQQHFQIDSVYARISGHHLNKRH